MIEKIHRYKGLLVFGLVLVAAAFVFGDFSRGRRNSSGGGTSILRVAGRSYSDKDLNRLGTGPVKLAQMLFGSGDYAPYGFVMELAKGFKSDNDLPEKFFTGRLLLRDAKEKFGIYPGAEEVSTFIRSMKAFAGTNKTFDEKKYRAFIERGMGQLALTENDLLDFADDLLAAKKLKTLLSAGLGSDRDAAAKSLALSKQQITADLACLPLGPFEDKIQPTEEEIKSYWEPIKDGFQTTPRRKFSYVLVTPETPADDASANAEPPETIAEAAATDEAKAAAKKKKDEAKTLKAAALAEKRREKNIEADKLVSDFTDKLEDAKGSGFEDLAKENGWEIKTTDFFTLADAPADMAINVRASSRGGKAVDELFHISETSDPISKFHQPIAVGENQWLIARLDGEEKAREKSFGEARAEARAKYIAQKAADNLKAAAEAASAKIKTALADGKTFADAAKEAELTGSKTVTNVTSTYKPDGATEPKNLFQAASNVDPGSMADVVIESDRAFVLHVIKREVVKDPNSATSIDAELSSAATQNEMFVFDSWLASRVEDAKIEQLNRSR